MFVDLLDFCERLAARYPEAKEPSDQVTDAIRKLVRKSCFTGVENQFSNGVSIYFPWADVAPSYEQLAFAQEAGWNDFLQAYVEETRRKPRGFKDGGKLLLDFPRRQTIQVRVSCPRQSNDSEKRANVKPENEAPSIPSTVCATRQSPWLAKG